MTDTYRVGVILSLRSQAKNKLKEVKPFLIIGPAAIIIAVFIIPSIHPSPGILMYARNIGMAILFVLGALCILGLLKILGEYLDIRKDLRRLTEDITDEEISRAKKEDPDIDLYF